jgi:hypothetical protein
MLAWSRIRGDGRERPKVSIQTLLSYRVFGETAMDMSRIRGVRGRRLALAVGIVGDGGRQPAFGAWANNCEP